MLEDLDRKMYSLSGGKPIDYTIPVEHVDDLSSTGRGKSWLQVAHTQPREQALMHSMVSQDIWNLSWVDEFDRIQWNAIACRDFMQKAAEIVDLIISLVHIGSGPPLRGEEIIRDQITNGIQARTIYLAFGQMLGIRRHSKDTNSRGMDPFNICYFPQSLTNSISYYLLVIRPLERLVAAQLYQGQSALEEYNLFLYVKYGKRFTSTQLSTVLEKVTSEHVGIGLGIQPLRHILIAFQRVYIEELRVARLNNIGDIISSHSSKTADTHYAVEFGQPEGYTAEYLLNVQDWCDSYHDAIGLGDRTIPLVPLRTNRRYAQKLGSAASRLGSMDSPSMTAEGLLPFVREMTGVAHKLAMEDLKPFLRKELQTAVAEATKYLVTAQPTLPTLPGTPGNPLQSHLGAPGSADARATKPLPLRVVHQFSTGEGGRRVKRGLSTGEQPQAKRPPHSIITTVAEPGSPSQTHWNPPSEIVEAPRAPATEDHVPIIPIADIEVPVTPTIEVGALVASSTDLEELNAKAMPALSPATRPQNQPHRIHFDTNVTKANIPSSSSIDKVVPRAEATSSRFLSVNLEPDQPEDQPSFNSAYPQADNILTALRKLRRDPLAAFKSAKQRELLESVLSGKHTIGILPTGGGKSIAYELPPICQDKVTIAAFPFRAILDQAASTCRERGIAFQQWTTTDFREIHDERLVIMSIETLLSPNMLE